MAGLAALTDDEKSELKEQFTVLDWGSKKLRRVARSSLAAEVQDADACGENLHRTLDRIWDRCGRIVTPLNGAFDWARARSNAEHVLRAAKFLSANSTRGHWILLFQLGCSVLF